MKVLNDYGSVLRTTLQPKLPDLAAQAAWVEENLVLSDVLFLVLGGVEQREETRDLARLGGLGARNPKLAGALTLGALAALGLQGLAGFSGEILILTGVFKAGFVWPAIVALVAIVLAAAYMLRLLQDTMNGPPVADLPERRDMTWAEGFAVAPLVAGFVLLGVDPGIVTSMFAEVGRAVGSR